jgi:hypothetical protein
MEPRTVADVRLMLKGQWPPEQIIKEPEGTKEPEGSLDDNSAVLDISAQTEDESAEPAKPSKRKRKP